MISLRPWHQKAKVKGFSLLLFLLFPFKS